MHHQGYTYSGLILTPGRPFRLARVSAGKTSMLEEEVVRAQPGFERNFERVVIGAAGGAPCHAVDRFQSA